MKQCLLLLIVLLSNSTYAQEVQNPELKVIYRNNPDKSQRPATFINGQFVISSIVDPNLIESVTLTKDEIEIDGTKYLGQLYIATKNSYSPKLISLNTLKDKYTNLKNKPAVFMIDGEIVNTDYDRLAVDENYILQIMVDGIKNGKEKIDLALIMLLTKTEANIKKLREIRTIGDGTLVN